MTQTLTFPEAARALNVSVRDLRLAIRANKIPAPAAKTNATTPLTQEWLDSVKAAKKADPKSVSRAALQSTPPFAHYPGTSAWRKYKSRVRDYYAFLASQAA